MARFLAIKVIDQPNGRLLGTKYVNLNAVRYVYHDISPESLRLAFDGDNSFGVAPIDIPKVLELIDSDSIPLSPG